ncbi:MAG: hypothetical protein GF317_21440 [Candidatus Lokiarchaeota archaeon]|nr:hypothetical protein [Candidatus Lokiarchaeota archaeon]MBD3202021.1 hypothetical protein [Candidatus Lokiarchaeota archaeon]
MAHINPEFTIDRKGRVLCKKHSNYQFLKEQIFSHLIDSRLIEKELTCKTCTHYFKDNCFFPRSEIDKIEYDRVIKKAFKCKLCGNKIDRMFTVIHKLYYEENFYVKIPLICCVCYEGLKRDKFMEFSKKRLSKLNYDSIITFFILIILLILTLSFGSWYYFIGAFSVIIFCVYIFLYYREKKKIENGLKYYAKNFIED